MSTLTVTPQQAQYLQQLVQQAAHAQQTLNTAVQLLALGSAARGALTHIDAETGVLTFTAPEAPAHAD